MRALMALLVVVVLVLASALAAEEWTSVRMCSMA